MHLFQSLVESNREKAAWAQSNITESDEHFSTRIVASALYMSIFSSALEAMLLHFANAEEKTVTNGKASYSSTFKSALPGLLKSLIKVHHDKMHNVEFCRTISKRMVNKPVPETIKSMTLQAINAEKRMIVDFMELASQSLSINGKQMNPVELGAYVEYVANSTLQSFGFQPATSVTSNPLPWVSALIDKEKSKGPVKKAQAVKPAMSQQNLTFTLDEDF